jgi:diguanylate cyclase (GGDEF)-like protein
LVEAAEVLRDSFRHSDILARLGGDEFAAFMLEANKDSIGSVVRRMEHKLDACNAMPSRSYDLSISVGIVPGDTNRLSNVEQLLSEADVLMYKNKQSKKVSREPSKSFP